jgi:transposase
MSMRLEDGNGVPKETARVARAAFPKGNPYLTIRDELGTIYTNQEFAELFSKTGQPGESPLLLMLTTILQFAEELSDREAADAVRSRIDWKYLLGLPLEDPGFDYSVLSEFRIRLIEGQREQQLLNKLLKLFVERKLLKGRRQQRTDSTHVLAMIRNLNRLETVGETLRFALNRLAESVPDWLRERAPQAWYERYGERFEQARLPQREAERAKLKLQIGQDGQQLLNWVDTPDSPERLRWLPAMQVLRQVWIQQYYLQGDVISWRANDNIPPAAQHLVSPYDTEARFSVKRQTEWAGYKVHLTEICEEACPHWITHVETTPATVQDAQVVETIHAALAEQDLLPSQHFLDMGYVDTRVLAESQKTYGVEIIGPIQKDNTWQAQAEDRLDVTHFAIDWEKHQVHCPNGKTSQFWREYPDITKQPRIYVYFRRNDCLPCLLHARCTQADTYRKLSFKPRPEYELLQWARNRQRTPDFLRLYKKRSGIEGTLSQGVRAFDLRRTRYIGLLKTHLQHVLTAIAINLIRFTKWISGVPIAKTRCSAFSRLALATC